MSRLPLRARVMAWFGLVCLVVTSVLAFGTWQLATSYMQDQRIDGAVRQTMVNARLVQTTLRREPAGLEKLITGLGSEVESAVLLVERGEWTSSGNLVDPRRLPSSLIDTVRGGQSAYQRLTLAGVPVLAVGVPLPEVSATYFEVFPLRELDRTFRFLSWILVAGTVASGAAGALLGRWASGYALQPLTQVTAAAAEAAGGDLGVRLPATRDPDLAPLARAFNETAERLQQQVTRDARFAGDVSHELRSPLTTMLNAMSVLRRRRADLPGGARQAVDLLDTDLRRFRRLVDDLLEISRTYSEDQLAVELLDLAELVRQAAPDHVDRLRVAPETAPLVLADRRCLERVVANLVDNAEQHGRGLVRLRVARDNGAVRLEVDDAGPGVPELERERIFERFARGSPSERDRTDSGVGLGLALVARHVRRHRGTARVEPRPGGGARFVVELPEATP
ncbi:MAG: ATP-binding protein [Micromonosporaceae bacterium]